MAMSVQVAALSASRSVRTRDHFDTRVRQHSQSPSYSPSLSLSLSLSPLPLFSASSLSLLYPPLPLSLSPSPSPLFPMGDIMVDNPSLTCLRMFNLSAPGLRSEQRPPGMRSATSTAAHYLRLRNNEYLN